MDTSPQKPLGKLTLAIAVVWSLVLVTVLAFVLWWSFGVDLQPSGTEQQATDRGDLQEILDPRYLENANLVDESTWEKIDTAVTPEAAQNPAEFAKFLARLTAEPAGLEEAQLTFPNGDKLIFFGPLYFSDQDWESVLNTINLDGVQQVNIMSTDTGDGLTMFTSATYLEELPGDGVNNDDQEIFERNITFVSEEQAGLADLQDIQKPVGVESLRHVVNYTSQDGKNNILFVADHEQVQEVENAVNKIQDVGISTPLTIAVQYAKDIDEEPSDDAANPPENTYKIQVLGNSYVSQQPGVFVPDNEARTVIDDLSSSLPAEQAPHLSKLTIASATPAYALYPPYYELNGLSSPSAGE